MDASAFLRRAFTRCSDFKCGPSSGWPVWRIMGKFIVLEGMDGSGKSTQTKRLTEYLKGRGLNVKTFHFPSEKGFYGKTVSAFLRGDFGKAEEVDPYFAAFIFAGDRRDMAEEVRSWISEYDVVLLDRYSFSNNAYQCAKLDNEEEISALSGWIMSLEFETFGIPRPDLSIFLSVPQTFVAKQLRKERRGEERKYLEGKQDIHENASGLQEKVGAMYRKMCSEYDELVLVDCADENGKMLDSGKIQKRIVNLLIEKEIISKE